MSILSYYTVRYHLFYFLNTVVARITHPPPPEQGLGPGTEEDQPREGGFLDLGGRECLACHISSTLPPGFPQDVGEVGGKLRTGSKRRQALLGRRGRSELYLVLDAKAFLLATPDR